MYCARESRDGHKGVSVFRMIERPGPVKESREKRQRQQSSKELSTGCFALPSIRLLQALGIRALGGDIVEPKKPMDANLIAVRNSGILRIFLWIPGALRTPVPSSSSWKTVVHDASHARTPITDTA